jgi:DNA-binding NtrC family response regulator
MLIQLSGKHTRVTLPALSAPRADDDDDPLTPTAPLRVLIIDDDADIRDVLIDMLADENMVATGAIDGLDGLNKLYDEPPPDVILLDMRMPRVNGHGFMRLVDTTSYSDIPIILISAESFPDRGAMQDERYIFVKKPIDWERTLPLVKRKALEGRRRRG